MNLVKDLLRLATWLSKKRKDPCRIVRLWALVALLRRPRTVFVLVTSGIATCVNIFRTSILDLCHPSWEPS
jgi:hypothetical protein